MTSTRLTYAGIFDDQVYRYSDNFRKQSIDEYNACFNRLLLQSLFFGRPFAINDGYVLQSPFLRNSLTDENSFLRVLAKNGYVVLLRRDKSRSLSGLVDWAKENGVSTLASVSEGSSNWEQTKDYLDKFEADLKAPNKTIGGVECGIKSWPKRDTAEVFKREMWALLECDGFPSDLLIDAKFEYEKIRNGFRKYLENPDAIAMENGRILAPRTFWERLVRRVHNEAVSIVYANQNDSNQEPIKHNRGRRFMEVANCVYHFSQAAAFAAQDEKFDVCTPPESTALRYCLAVDEVSGQVKPIPDVKGPANLFDADASLIEDFLRNDGLIKAKNEYVAAAEAYMSTLTDEDYRTLEGTTAAYSKELDKFLQPESTKVLTLDNCLRLVVGGSITGLSTWLKGDSPETTLPVAIVALLVGTLGVPIIKRVGRMASTVRMESAIGEFQSNTTSLFFVEPLGTNVDNVRKLEEKY